MYFWPALFERLQNLLHHSNLGNRTAYLWSISWVCHAVLCAILLLAEKRNINLCRLINSNSVFPNGFIYNICKKVVGNMTTNASSNS